MKWKAVSLAMCAALIALGFFGMLVAQDQPLPHRYLQHKESQQLDDLPEADRTAASSTNTDPGSFASHLPVVSIDTGGQEIPGGPSYDENGKAVTDESGIAIPSLAEDGSETISASIAVYDSQGIANRLSDQPTVESRCEIRVRGNSSIHYDKKNYRVLLTNEDGTDNDQEIMGMEASETWALQGTSIDKTMLRNYLTYNAAAQFMNGFVPEIRYCEVFLNGEYIGLYMMTETVKMEEGRVQLTPSDAKRDETSYIVAIDERKETPTTISEFLHYTLRQGMLTDIVYPSEASLTEGQKDYIEQDLSDFEKALYSYDYDTADYGYWSSIDVQSFVDGFVLNEFVVNDDFGAFSTYLFKDVRGKVTFGPIWDYDNAYNLYQNETPVDKFYLVERPWFYMLFKDEAFCEQTIARYRELREGPLSEESLFSALDATAEYLAPALERNFQRWDSSFTSDQYLQPEDRNPASNAEAIEDLKTFIHERGEWLDQHIENLRQYSHESAVKKSNH